jgi:hypothetical protein
VESAVGEALTISAGSTTAGTSSNKAGGALTIQGGQGKGSGAGGDIVFKTANAGSSGTVINALATALTLSDDLSSTFGGVVAVGDNARINMGASLGAVIVHNTEVVGYNAEASTGSDLLGSGVIVGSSSHLDVAANSLIISNATTDGDIAFFVADGGNSIGIMTIKGADGNVVLYNSVGATPSLDIYNKGTTSSNKFIRFWDASAVMGWIDHADDDTTNYNTTSDYRLKENSVTLAGAVTRVKNLKPYRFNFKRYPDKTRDGFFAHEVATVVPESVSGAKDALNADDSILPQGMDSSKLVPLLTAAIQELDARITTLES